MSQKDRADSGQSWTVSKLDCSQYLFLVPVGPETAFVGPDCKFAMSEDEDVEVSVQVSTSLYSQSASSMSFAKQHDLSAVGILGAFQVSSNHAHQFAMATSQSQSKGEFRNCCRSQIRCQKTRESSSQTWCTGATDFAFRYMKAEVLCFKVEGTSKTCTVHVPISGSSLLQLSREQIVEFSNSNVLDAESWAPLRALIPELKVYTRQSIESCLTPKLIEPDDEASSSEKERELLPKKPFSTTAVRRDPGDGQLYFREDFLTFYGAKVGPIVWQGVEDSEIFLESLKKGTTIQALADGQWWAAEVVTVSKKKSATPVKVHWRGYDKSSDEWVALHDIRSKILQASSPKKFQQKADKKAKWTTSDGPSQIRRASLAGLSAMAFSSPVNEVSLEVEHKKMIFVSDQVPFYEVLLKALRDDVLAVPVNYQSWDTHELLRNVVIRAGPPKQQFDCIGFVDHGDANEFCLLKASSWHPPTVSLEDLQGCLSATAEKGRNTVLLLQTLSKYLTAPKVLGQGRDDPVSRFDFLTCSSESCLEVVDFLERKTQVNCRFATKDLTVIQRFQSFAENGVDCMVDDTIASMRAMESLKKASPEYFMEERLAGWIRAESVVMKRASRRVSSMVMDVGGSLLAELELEKQ